jgi:hypothetical protein
LLSFREISTPTLQAQGEQRRLPISTLAGTIPTGLSVYGQSDPVDKRMRTYRYLHVPVIKNGGGTGPEHYKIEKSD